MSKNTKVVNDIKSLLVKFGFLKAGFAKLLDGTEVRVEGDELIEGAAVYVVTEEGDIPAPDGSHELEDGTKIETVEGLITKVEVVSEDAPAEMEEIEIEIGEEEKPLEEEVEMEGEEVIEVAVPGELPAEIAAPAVEAIVEALVPILEEVKSLSEELKKMKAEFKSFKNEPAGSPVNKTKKDFNKVQDADELVNKILAMKKANR